jgi:putative tricarboxylic transport membrane protein
VTEVLVEKGVSIFFLIFSIGYLFCAREFAFGVLVAPKAGFLPTIAAITAIVLSILILVKQAIDNQIKKPDSVHWRKLFFVTIGVLLYVVLLNVIGYFAATCIALFYLFKLSDTQGWLLPFLIATITATVFYVVFQVLLGTQLP